MRARIMDGNDDDTMSIDWSSFIIENVENKDNGDQGDMFRICDEDEMYAFLGLGDEDEEMNRTHPKPSNFASHFTSESNSFDPSDLDVAMPVDDENAEMVNILHDVDHPNLKLGTLCPCLFQLFGASGHQKLLRTAKRSAFQSASIKFVWAKTIQNQHKHIIG